MSVSNYVSRATQEISNSGTLHRDPRVYDDRASAKPKDEKQIIG